LKLNWNFAEMNLRRSALSVNRMKKSQATVAAAMLALASGIIGGLIQGWQARYAEEGKNNALVKIEGIKVDANIELDKRRFETSLITKATESPDRLEQIKNLKFYLKAGFLRDPEGKLADIDEDEYPSSTPPEVRRPSPSGTQTIERLLELFGAPAKQIGTNCTPSDNTILSAQLVTDIVGKFRVTMLKPPSLL
jgi:hypothetical protein